MSKIVLFIGSLLSMVACNSYTPEKSSDPAGYATLHDTIAKDSSALSKKEVTKIYCRAIAEFIKATNKKHNTVFDTLYFGRHVYGQPDDFPDIELPGTIENTTVRLITPEEGLKIQKERKSLVYVNMIGWVSKENAEFILVVFSNGGEHQYDCSINYKYNAAVGEFEQEELRFEYFLYKQ